MLPIAVKHIPSGTYIAERAFYANTMWDRARGWLGKPRAEAGEGLLLRPCSSIHTMGMKFSLDLLFLDKGNRVVKLMRSLSPWRAVLSGAQGILELPAGTLTRVPVKVGDLLEITQRKT
jgi:uncharacterized protein